MADKSSSNSTQDNFTTVTCWDEYDMETNNQKGLIKRSAIWAKIRTCT